MKHIIIILLCTVLPLTVSASASDDRAQGRQIKLIYIPDSLACYDLTDNESPWCWQRTLQTDNLIIFWEKGFGYDLSSPPDLDGHPMTVNTQALYERLETFYRYYRDTLQFIRPGSKADRYKMMVMLHYSLEGTAYGGTYDNFIGALWVAPNRIQDRTMNCMAHELGHSFQLQIPADSISDAWGGSGFYEMTSQWMLWRVNPHWLTDENYHFEAFKQLTHKAFLDGENIYHSPYVLQYWAQRHGLTSIAELYRNGRIGEDPVMTYQRLYGITQEQFCDEMIDCYQHLVNIDLGHAWQETRQYACTFDTPMQASTRKGYYRPVADRIPEDYGFNVVQLEMPASGDLSNISVEVKSDQPMRYALVLVTPDGQTICGTPFSKGKATLPTLHSPLSTLHLIVMGAPHDHRMLRWDDDTPNRQYPYDVRFHGTKPLSSN